MGNEGIRALSEALKVSTTLASLGLGCMHHQQSESKQGTTSTTAYKQAAGLALKKYER